MHALFALLFALATAQQFGQFASPYGQYGQANFGAPTDLNPGQQQYGSPGQPAATQPKANVPSAFDVSQQSLNVIAAGHQVRGASILFSMPQFGLTALGSYSKARGQSVNLRRIRRAQNQLGATTAPGSAEYQDQMDDLKLQREAARSQYRRRTSEIFAGSLPFPPLFEGRAHQALLDLAKNQRDDAIADVQQDPSPENYAKLRNARSDINQQEEWRDANTLDILGSSNPALVGIAPLKRISASKIALRSARRDHKSIVDAYTQNPSEDNWWNMRLSSIKLRALDKDIEANQGEASFKLLPGTPLKALGQYYMNDRFLKEDRLWQKYQRLSLDNLNRQRANAGEAPSSAGSRMVSLAGYGPALGARY